MPKNVFPCKTLWQLAKARGWNYRRTVQAADDGILKTMMMGTDRVVTPTAEEQYAKLLQGEISAPVQASNAA